MTARDRAHDLVGGPTLVMLIGPPAVGKMTVGQALAALTGYMLFHDSVLRRWDGIPGQDVDRVHGLPQGAVAQAAFAPALLEPAILGSITDEEWRQRIALRLAEQYQLGHAAAARAVLAWSESAGRCDEAVLALVQRVRRRVPVGLVTNATSRLDRDLERLGLGNAFDAVINSSRVRARKPEPGIFHAAAQALRVALPEALFIDDTLSNVIAAQALGLTSYQFENAAQMLGMLTQYGLLV